jgi:hypothetical protein
MSMARNRRVTPHTLSLQEKSSAKRAMVLLDWPQPHHLWIGRNRGDSCSLSDRPTPASIPAGILALGPSCVSPAAQLKRE